MTKRQIVFGVICFLVGVLVGIEIAGNLDALVRLVIIMAIILLCVYLALPSLLRRTRARRVAAQRVPQRRTQRRDADIRAFLTELHETGQQNDAQEQERSKKMLNLEPETAQFLNILIRSSRRTRLLEIGTSK